MNNLLKASAAVVAFGISQMTIAAPIHIGDYHLANASNSHGIWFNKKIKHEGVWNDNKYLNLQASTFNVVDNGAGYSANLSGSVFDEDIQGGFTFSVDMTYRCTGITACGLSSQPLGNVPNTVDQERFDFYDLDDMIGGPAQTELVGTGSLAGMTVGITQKPGNGSKPFRFGYGADWYNLFRLGGSGWFDIAYVNGTPSDVEFHATTGDFNVKVPEPGTVALLGLGLIGLGISRKKK